MTSIGSPSPFFFGGKKAYEVERSLRFNDDDSAYLNRTPSGAGNRKKWTWSCWVKRSTIVSSKTLFMAGTNGVSDCEMYFSTDYFRFLNRTSGSMNTLLDTTALYRDVSAWYHFVVVWDTAQSNADDRVKIYVNGTQVTSFRTNTRPSQNTDSHINNNIEHRVGARTTNNTDKFDGYMAEINFIDGQAYDPSYFAETDALTGQWNPKKYVGSYGTNGFYLNFSDNSGTTATTLGKDSSGNGNNFTPNNFAVSDAIKDSPTNNFSTLNPLDRTVWLTNIDIATLSEGNLQASGANNKAFSSIGIEKNDTNKYYAEMYVNSNDANNYSVLIVSQQNASVFEVGYNGPQGTKQINRGSHQSYGATFDAGDVIGVLVDRANNQVTFYKNGVSQGAISNTFSTTSPNDIAYIGAYYYGNVQTFNFGQDSTFAGAVSSGGNTDANGIGDFKYAVPSGAKALCSANLPDPTINFPDKHFDTVLYTGDGSATGSQTDVLKFQPDWLWSKPRTATYAHLLYDAVRGAGNSKALNLGGGASPGAGAEGSAGDNAVYGFLSSFDANGFSYTKGSAGTTFFNQSGINYAVWNWNAGDTDGKTYTVKVVSDSGNKYRFDDFGTSAVTLDLAEGGTYIFDQSDSSNVGHPLRFSTTSNGTHGGGSEYTTGVTTAGTPGSSGAYTQIVVAASAPTLYYYCTQHSGMGGQVNTNSTLGSSNFDGSVQSTVKANPTAGFSIVRYPGGQSSPYTIGHGLGVAPKIIITKSITNVVNWGVYFNILGVNTNWLSLNTSASLGLNGNSEMGGAYAVLNASTVQMDNAAFGGTGTSLIMYAFSEVAGYSKFGKYTGNGSTDGTFVFTGFRPAVIILKRTNSAASWVIHDNKRAGYNGDNDYLHPDLVQAESDGSTGTLDILSNGFKLRMTAGTHNGNGDTFIYLAFAESPFKYARAR